MQSSSSYLPLSKRKNSSKLARRDGSSSALTSLLSVDAWSVIFFELEISALHSFLLLCKDANELFGNAKSLDLWKEQNQHKILQLATQRLTRRLQSVPPRIAFLIHHLIAERKAIMAGGYVLQCITGQSFQDTDIDIFLETNANEDYEDYSYRFERLVHEIKGKNSGHLYTYREIFNCHDNLSNVRGVHFLEVQDFPTLKFIHVFDNPSKQALGYSFESLSEYLEQAFDLDICKCWYDGTSVRSLHVPQQLKRIGTMDYQAVKYAENAPWTQERAQRMGETIEERTVKYEQRGFEIVNKKAIA